MYEAIRSLFTLGWSPQRPQYRPLPQHVTRTLVPSSGGDLELLTSKPTNPDPTAPAIFFAHGGYGSAGVWLEWMTYLHDAGYQGRLYAFSARNHGASYSVCYFKMVYRTSLNHIASDMKTAFDFARKQEAADGNSQDLILVGHSSGGGLAQYALAKGLLRCRALCLVDSVPHFGSLNVYVNWAKHDPWFILRMMLHFQHPTSPLSSPRLVHGAFFGHMYPMSRIPQFMQWMPKYESMGWPSAMFGSFSAWWRGKSQWLDVREIVNNVSGSEQRGTKDSVCVLKGSEDMMMDDRIILRQAAEYREASNQPAQSEKPSSPAMRRPPGTQAIDGADVESQDGVRVVIVHHAGHHVQNDVQQETGAEALLQFFKQF